MRLLKFTIIFILLTLKAFPQKAYGNDVKECLKKYKLQDNTPLLIVSINSNDCINCIVPLGKLIENIDKQGIENVVFLIDGITDSEIPKYFKEVLNFNPANKKIFTDILFYRSINSTYNSKVYILNKGKKKYEKTIKEIEDYNWLNENFPKTFKAKVSIIDSLTVNGEYLNGISLDVIDSNKVIVLNNKYQEVSILNVKDNIISNKITNNSLNLNIDSLLRICISDTSMLNYNLWHRHQKQNYFTKNPLFPEVQLMGISNQEGHLFITAGIVFVNPSYENKDTFLMVGKLPLLIEVSNELKIKNIFYFNPEIEKASGNYILKISVPYYYLSDQRQFAFRSIYYSSTGKFKKSKANIFCKVDLTNKISFDRIGNIDLPIFFIKNGYYNDFTNSSFKNLNDSIYLFFNYTPFAYNITSNNSLAIKNTNYEKNHFGSDVTKFKTYFNLQTISQYDKSTNLVWSYINDLKNPCFTFTDANGIELGKDTLSSLKCFAIKEYAGQIFIFSLQNNEGKIIIYKCKVL